MNSIDSILHFDKQLGTFIGHYGIWTYLLLFLILFCETGLVVTPFLPGDSLLFAAGAFAATGVLDIRWLLLLLAVAVVVGDTVNYGIGNILGPRVFRNEDSRWLKKEYLSRTSGFFEKYGGKTIIIARFVPIVRTFAPFVAGVGAMSYRRFLSYNIIGGVGWVAMFTVGGYYFGNLAFVKTNFSLVLVAIIAMSVVPAAIELVRHKQLLRAETESSGG